MAWDSTPPPTYQGTLPKLFLRSQATLSMPLSDLGSCSGGKGKEAQRYLVEFILQFPHFLF